MKRSKFIYSVITLAFGLVAFASCDDFLDVMPDNRTVIDSEDKVKALLVTAYLDHDYNLFTELLSDNVDEYPNTYTERFIDELYRWKDPKESNNESPESFWESAYLAISTANNALEGKDSHAERMQGRGSVGACLCPLYVGQYLLSEL